MCFRGSTDEARSLDVYVRLMRATESVSSLVYGHLAEAGLTVSQFGVIEVLCHLGPLSQAEIARKILRSSGNITMIIDNLEKRGLVRRERNEQDRRYYRIHLTEKGKTLMSAIFPRHAGLIVSAMNALTGEEQEILGSLCRKLGLQGKN